MLEIYIVSFVVSYFYVGMKSIQQLNVAHKMYWFIPPISVIMCLLEVFVVSTVAKTAGMEALFPLALSLGLGGGFGSVCATVLHDRYLEKK